MSRPKVFYSICSQHQFGDVAGECPTCKIGSWHEVSERESAFMEQHSWAFDQCKLCDAAFHLDLNREFCPLCECELKSD